MKKWQAEDTYPSEPVFIPTPEATEEDDGKNTDNSMQILLPGGSYGN